MSKLIVKLILCFVFILPFFSIDTAAAATREKTNNRDIEVTTGESVGQKWHIDKNHVLYWNGKPYVPHAINDFPLLKPFMSKEEINSEVLPGIDYLMDNGIIDISIELGFLIEEYLPYIKEDLNKQELSPYDLDVLQKEMETNLKIIVDHITRRGGTYILVDSIDPVIPQLGGGDLIIASRGGGIEEGSRVVSLEFMLDQKTQNAYQKHLRRFKQAAVTKGLRGFLFNWEINGQGKIEGTPEELAAGLSKMLDIYGKMIKEEIADVPVFYGIADSVTGQAELLPYLSGVYADNIDGIYVQIHGAMPEEIRFHAKQLLVTRQLNSCSKTKLFWGYGQATPLSFALYRSKQLMHDHYQEMIDVGMTGFMHDQISSWGYIEFGLPFDSVELRNRNKRWWGELKPILKSKVLNYARNNKFSSGKWDVIIERNELKARKPKVLNAEQVSKIARNHPDVNRALNLGADLGEPNFNPDYGIWDIYILGLGVNVWVEDSKDGKVLFSEIKLIDDARKAGYPIPSDEWLINFSREEEFKEIQKQGNQQEIEEAKEHLKNSQNGYSNRGTETEFKSPWEQAERERIIELEHELKEAQEQGNQQEIEEIRELLQELELDNNE